MPHPVYRVLVSSTFEDLRPERQAVLHAISDLNIVINHLGLAVVPVDLITGASTHPPLEVCLDEVRHCDLVVTVVGMKYGSITKSGLSFTELEYDEASKHSKYQLCYLKSDKALMLVENIDLDPPKVSSLKAFKEKIDKQKKRDAFASPEELRGHVLRDLAKWFFLLPNVVAVAEQRGGGSTIDTLARFYTFVQHQHYTEAAHFLIDCSTQKDLRRLGVLALYPEMLAELLELPSLTPPSKITDPTLRVRLLMELHDSNPYSLVGRAAFDEANLLVEKASITVYEFHIARRWATLAVSGHCDRHALQSLKKMLRCARKTGNTHNKAEAAVTVGRYYRWVNDHKRAKRWLLRSVANLRKDAPSCPFCMCTAFMELGHETIGTTASGADCSFGHECLAKAFLIARAIPDRSRQAAALRAMADHFDAHDGTTEAVASLLLAAKLMREASPSDETADVTKLLGPMMARHGREAIRSEMQAVEHTAEIVVNNTLAQFKLESFVESLCFQETPCGDHW